MDFGTLVLVLGPSNGHIARKDQKEPKKLEK